MKRKINILYIVIAAILMVGCTEKAPSLSGKGYGSANVVREWAGGEADTLYTQQAAMAVYEYQRAPNKV